MRRFIYLLLLAIGFSQFAFSQITGTYTIPGAPYATIASAITALNTSGVGAGGVTFNITAGYTETFASPTAGYINTNTATIANKIIFQKSGAGANPKITAGIGTGTFDAIICFNGVQYITFDGIDIYENAANITTTTQMEWGYALLKVSGTQGSQNITIKNCTISLTQAYTATYGIYANNHTTASLTALTVTAVTGQNSNNKFYGNTLTSTYNGIYINGYVDAVAPYAYYDQGNDIGSVTGNTFTNFAGGSVTSYQVYMAYQNNFLIANSNINGGAGSTGSVYGIYGSTATNANGSIYGNTVQITTAGTTGYIYGIYNSGLGTAGTTNTLSIYNNTIQNCTQPTSTTSYFYGIYNAATAFTVNMYGNVVNNNVFGGSYYMYLCYTTSVAGGTANVYNNTVSNNQRSGLGTQSGTSTFYCLYIGGSGTTSIHDNNIFGNSIGPVGPTYGGTIYSLYCSNSAPLQNVYNNSIHDQTITSSYTSSHVIYGIYSFPGSASTGSIYNNNIYNLNMTLTGTGYGYMYGLYSYYQSSVYGNTMYNLNITNSSTGYGYGYGYYLNGSTQSNNVFKNKLYGVSMAGASGYFYGMYIGSGVTMNLYNNYISDIKVPASTSSTYGVYISGGTNVNLYYNTIYLNATSSSATTFNMYGVYASTTPNVELRNNIIVNTSTAPGSTTYRAACYYRSSTTFGTYAATSNNNDFYAGIPSATNLIYYDLTNSIQTLAAYKTLVSPRDAASVSELPPFMNILATPYDLHLKTTILTQCESGGSIISTPAITVDYDNDARYPNPGYPNNPSSPASAPDIGADEFAGLLLDITPPSISFTPFLNTSSTAARILTTTITDASGVPTTGIGRPVLYWRINSGTWNNVAGTWVSGSTYTFTFGSGAVLNDVISYYVVAQDVVTTPNIGSNPSAGAAGFTPNPPACSTIPTTPYTYAIVGTLCGTFDVGVGKAYTTLTAAIADLNNKEMSCAVTFRLTDATYSASETFPIVINANPGSSAVNTLTIKTATGVNATISGVVASGALIKVLNPNTTIDGSNTAGGTTRNLTITNTSATAPTVLVIGSTGATPITNSTLKNCTIINGANTATAIMVSDGATPGSAGYFNNITIQNNSIQQAYIGLYCIANAVAGNGSGMVITGNDLNTSGTNSIRLVGIYAQGVDGITISNNNIGNIANAADAANLTGIWLATGTMNCTVSGNIITGINGTATGPRGIAISSAVTGSNILVTDNTISGFTTASTQVSYGIYFFSTTGGCTMQKNKIFDIKNTNSGGYSAIGIALASTLTAAATTVQNNLIYDVAAYGYSSTTTDNGFGINILSGGGYYLYFNTVRLSTDQTIATGNPACLIINSAVATPNSLDIRNNIFYIDATMGTNRYAVLCNATNAVFSAIDYNDYYSTGPNLGYLGVARLDLAAWKTGTGKDVNSVSVNPVFTSLTNLIPTTALMNNAGTYIASVPIDYAGTSRSNPPDIGAYEYSLDPLAITSAATLVLTTSATLNGNFNANTTTLNTWFDYGLTTAYGSNIAATPASVTGSTLTLASAALTSLIPQTTYHFRARGVTTGGMIVYGADLTFTTPVPPPSVITTAATLVSATGATLNGTVNANGGSTTVSFDYGLTTGYGITVPGVPLTITGNTVTGSLAVLTGLQPNTTYNFRIKGINSGGTSTGNNLTFTTLAMAPTVTTTAATAIGTTNATLNGTVNANNSSSTVSFDYGLTPAFGLIIAGVPSPVTGMATVNVSAVLTGLLTNTTYYFRANATNSAGTTSGLTLSFLTGCPQPAAAGPITGPGSTCALSTGNVYTVGTIANAVSYAWTLPAGAVITAGAGTNTITVTFGSTSGNITVAGVGACGNGTPSTYVVTVNALPTPTITGSTTSCLTSTNNVYTTQTGMTNYIWSVSAGGTITAGGTATSSTVTVTWTTTGAKTVCVNYTNANGCTAAAASCYNVTVNALPTPTITGTAAVCQGTTGNVYTTQAAMTNYIWTVSPGGTITAGGTSTSNTVTVTWTTSGAKTVTVNYTNANGCTALAAASFPVTVNAVPVPTIGSTNDPCAGSTNNMYYTESGMTGYVWTVSSGGVIASGQGTSILNVTWNVLGVQTVSVNYTNPAACTALAPTVYTLFVSSPPNAAGAITGTATVCAGANGVAYSTTPIVGVSIYTWSVPSGATIASGAGTTSITVNYSAAAVSGDVTVAGTNQCGNGPSSTFAVSVNPLPAAAGTITGPATVCAGAAGVAYSVAAITNASTYVWTVPAGAVITSGGTTRNILVTFGPAAGTGVITVKGTNTCGSGTVSPNFSVTMNAIPAAPVVTVAGNVLTSSAPSGNQWYYEGTAIAGATGQSYTVVNNTGYYWCVVTVNGCSSPISNKVWVVITGQQELQNSNFSIYPVPNDGKFTVSITSPVQETFTIVVYNQLGAKIYELGDVQVNGTFEKQVDLRPVASGIYSVVFLNNEHKVVKKILVNK